MRVESAVFGALLAAPIVSAQDPKPTAQPISWYPCTQNGTAAFFCGTLEVPLDYTDPAAGRLNLSLVKVNATKEPFKGSILFNPGGPGLGARSFIANAADALLTMTGGQFDLIAHDPRGTGATIPYTCYTDAERYISALWSPHTSNVTDVAPGRIFAERRYFAQACLREQSETGSLIGTAFTARDMMQIVDSLNEDGMLRYWGFSYGTALGATVAAMFPDRVDKVILDGVLNMHQYYAGRDVQQVLKSDGAFRTFIEGCVGAPKACVLARENSTADGLEQKIDELLNTIRTQPLAVGPSLVDIVEYGTLKGLMIGGLRAPPSTWPVLATLLNSLFTRNATAYQSSAAYLGGLLTEPGWPEEGLDATFGIRCSDASFRTDNLTEVLPLVEEMEHTSRYVGDLVAAAQPLSCAQWPFAAKERIDWRGGYQTKSPILLIGNPFDPLTPLESAFNVSADFDSSVVLQHNGGGHCSLGQTSLCTVNVIRDYFINGTVPAAGTVCEPDEPGFSTENATLRRRAKRTDDDALLIDAIVKLRESVDFRSR